MSKFKQLLSQNFTLACYLLTMLHSTSGFAANGNIQNGQKLFKSCASCHQIGANARHGFGPALHQMFGQKAGSAAGYAYSNAMRTSNVIWDESNLRSFLKDPQALIPGTKMRLWGFSDEQQIADLIAYLKAQQVARQ